MGRSTSLLFVLALTVPLAGCRTGQMQLTHSTSASAPRVSALPPAELAAYSEAEPLPAPASWAEYGHPVQTLTMGSDDRLTVRQAIGCRSTNAATLMSLSTNSNEPISIEERIQFHRAMALADGGHFDESLSELSDLIGHAPACCKLGALCYERGHLAESRDLLEQAHQADPDRSDIRILNRWVQIQSESVVR